jgi:hypothetical protein
MPDDWVRLLAGSRISKEDQARDPTVRVGMRDCVCVSVNLRRGWRNGGALQAVLEVLEFYMNEQRESEEAARLAAHELPPLPAELPAETTSSPGAETAVCVRLKRRVVGRVAS